MGWEAHEYWQAPEDCASVVTGRVGNNLLRAHLVPTMDDLEWTWWAAVQEEGGRKLIVLAIIRYVKGLSCYGIVLLSESEDPLYTNCPPDLLELVGPPTGERSREWRARVQAESATYH